MQETMNIIYPFNPLNSKEADEPYQEEYQIIKSAGVKCSLFDFDALEYDEFKPKPNIEFGDLVLYRGWMLSPEGYKKLVGFIKSKGASPITTYEEYLKCHHLPGWYEECKEFTSESKFFSNDEYLEKNIASLGWEAFFIKDFVKSNSTEKGSVALSPVEAIEIVQLIKKYRGSIEGGIAVRRVENYIEETEIRYFIMNGKIYSPTKKSLEIVEAIAEIITAPFFSVDIIQRDDGKYRVVEIGDGQVSDKKAWDISTFSAMLIENA